MSRHTGERRFPEFSATLPQIDNRLLVYQKTDIIYIFPARLMTNFPGNCATAFKLNPVMCNRWSFSL
jgi:hypothetical protein